MIERLDPFGLPQPGTDKLATSSAVAKVQKNDDPSEGLRAPRAPRQRNAKAPRRK